MAKIVTEADIERTLKCKVSALKGEYWKIRVLQKNGIPDRLILLPGGRLFFVELKKPVGGILSPVQKVIHRLLSRLGFPVYCIYTFEDLNNFIYDVAL